jgi:hypothetical protein
MQKRLVTNQILLLSLFMKKGKFSLFLEPAIQARKGHV